MKKLTIPTTAVTEIALLAALITVTGAIKLPSLAPGLEFQLSAPLAVATTARAGPLGTFTARVTLSFVVGKGVWALVAAAVPGMVFTFLAAPLLTKILDRIARLRHAADARA